MKIVITGAAGLLGWHLRCHLRTAGPDGHEVVAVDHSGFQDDGILREAVESADAVVHLAGRNRGDDDEVAADNVAITGRLIKFLASASGDASGAAAKVPHVVFSSSTQVDSETAYGASKRRCSELLSKYQAASGARFTNVIFPHLFGEHGKPFYNSVVSTFCHQLATGEGGVPQIHTDGELNLLHCQDAARLIAEALESVDSGNRNDDSNGEDNDAELRPQGRRILVSELLAELQQMSGNYDGGVVPDLADAFRMRLFNTYRSFIPAERRCAELQLHTDPRGHLFEAVKTFGGGQTFFSSTCSGITRGEHFHTRKVERFLVVEGEAVIRLRRLFDDSVVEYRVSGSRPVYVDMPTLHTHNITNVGDGNLLTLFWVNEIFDESDPDTFREDV